MRKGVRAVPWIKKGRLKRRHNSEAQENPGATSDTFVDSSLDQVKLLSELLVAIADGPLNVPALKSVAGLAGKVVLIAQVRLMSMWRIDAIVATS